MINFKSIKWGYGVIISLILGLSGCYMDGQNSQRAESASQATVTTDNTNKPKAVQKSYASKDPTQKSTPGPKRAAAPQLPVIQ